MGDGSDTRNKILSLEVVLSHRRQARLDQQTVVWTNGCFDLLHVGHIYSLQAAARLGDILIVGLNSDSSIRQIKGQDRPIVPLAERALVVSALACVDYVTWFDEETPEVALSELRPDIHCKGAEYAPPHGRPIPEASLVESYGGRIEFIPLLPANSTTDLVERILRRARQ